MTETKRLQLYPLDATDTRDLWNAVDSSRPQLEPWLPWVPFNVDLDSSGRSEVKDYIEAFFRQIDKPESIKKQFVNGCKPQPTM